MVWTYQSQVEIVQIIKIFMALLQWFWNTAAAAAAVNAHTNIMQIFPAFLFLYSILLIFVIIIFGKKSSLEKNKDNEEWIWECEGERKTIIIIFYDFNT